MKDALDPHLVSPTSSPIAKLLVLIPLAAIPSCVTPVSVEADTHGSSNGNSAEAWDSSGNNDLSEGGDVGDSSHGNGTTATGGEASDTGPTDPTSAGVTIGGEGTSTGSSDTSMDDGQGTTGLEPVEYPRIAFHRPGGPWGTVPMLFANGDGTWSSTNSAAPGWANQPDVVAVRGDFDGDGLPDIAFHRPGGPWTTVPVLFANGDGSWGSTNSAAPGWANQQDVVAVPGDYDGDGLPDIAFHRPGGPWGTVPVLFSNGDGTWSATNSTAPGWANQPGVVAVPGDYDGNGLPDIAFHRPGGPWNTVPVLLANGDGTWSSTNSTAPDWANQPDVVAVPGDYDGNGLYDIAFHRPDGPWSTVPVLFANGDGTWSSSNFAAPGWANQQDVVAVPGDYDGNGLPDIAFHRPNGPWGTVPVLFANGDGSWSSTNSAAPSWANQPDVVAVPGDYDGDGLPDIAFHRPGGPWSTVPILFTNGDGSWSPTNSAAPGWANQPGVFAVR